MAEQRVPLQPPFRLVPPEQVQMDNVRAAITSLPFEILNAIIWDERLKLEDLEALRLSSRRLGEAAAGRLFYRLQISKLKTDRHAFLSVCRSPHLARHVRELEWLEISCDEEFPRRIEDLLDPPAEEGEEDLCRHFEAVLSEFWLLNTPVKLIESEHNEDEELDDGEEEENERYEEGEFEGHQELEDEEFEDEEEEENERGELEVEELEGHEELEDEEFDDDDEDEKNERHVEEISKRHREIELTRGNTVSAFRHEFESALDALTNLHTFISRPMSSEREINPDSEYPIAASFLQTHQDMPETDAPPQTNDGLFLFLIPAMARPNSTVRHLRWHDEFPGRSYLRPVPETAWAGLESLDICFTPAESTLVDWHSVQDSLFPALKHAAATLKRLKFCADHGSLTIPHMEMAYMVLGDNLATAPGCALRSLSLVSLKAKDDLLVAAIQANASSLQYLHFESMRIRSPLMRRLVELGCLNNLKRFRILEEDAAEEVDERALVRYVNAGGSITAAQDRERGGLLAWEVHDMDLVRARLGKEHHMWATTLVYFPGHMALERWSGDEDSDDDDDETSRAYRRRHNAPKWTFGSFLRDDGVPQVYCTQVPDSDLDGYRTQIWKFTSRDGEVGYGTDPLFYFGEWDTEDGDREEPTPLGSALRQFFWSPYGPVEETGPPEGAFVYSDREDPTLDSGWRSDHRYVRSEDESESLSS